jgi:hypothetical protein
MQRLALATAALVEQNDAVHIGTPETTHARTAAAAWPTVKKHDWLAFGVTALFEIQLVAAVDFDKA